MISRSEKHWVVVTVFVVNAVMSTGQVPQVTQWERVVDQSATEDLESVVFIDDSTVVAVGSNGCIRRGVPARAFTAVEGHFGMPTYRSVVTDGRSMVVCAGDSGLVGLSTDSGKTWSVYRPVGLGNIRQAGIESSGAIVLATDRGVFRRDETGAVTPFLDGDMTGVALHPDGSLIAAYRSGTVATSRDAGVTWQTDVELSTSWPIVKLIRTDSTVLVLHQQFVTWRTSDSQVDTSYIPSGTNFTFTDLTVSGNRWWATGEDFALEHAYSVDNGRTWVVSNGFKIRASRAIATRGGTLVCVGMRGAYVYGPMSTAVDQTFKIYGFATASTEVPMGTVKGLRAVADTLYTLWDGPAVRVVRHAVTVDTLYEAPSSLNIEARALWVKGPRFFVVMDTLANFETPSGWVTKRRFRICTGLVGDSSYTMVDAPSWDLPATTSYADDDGNIYVGCVGRPYVFRYSSGNDSLDSLDNFPLQSIVKIIGRNQTVVVVGKSSIAASTDQGASWSVSETNLPWIPHNSTIGASGRLCIARIDASGSSGSLKTATSDNLGQSWAAQAPVVVNGPGDPLLSMEATESGRVITSGLGDQILLSLNNGQSYTPVRTPTPAMAMIYASIFAGTDSIVIGGAMDILLRGHVNVVSSVGDVETGTTPVSIETEVTFVEEYDLLGRRVSVYDPGQEFHLRDYVDQVRSARNGVSFLVCRYTDHTVRCWKVLW